MVGFGGSFGGPDEGAEGFAEPAGVVEPPVAGTVEVAEGVAEDEPVPVIVVVVYEVPPVWTIPSLALFGTLVKCLRKGFLLLICARRLR